MEYLLKVTSLTSIAHQHQVKSFFQFRFYCFLLLKIIFFRMEHLLKVTSLTSISHQHQVTYFFQFQEYSELTEPRQK